MKQIKPLNIWKNGKIEKAIYIFLQINFDNLIDLATFYYSLKDENQNQILDGNINIDGEDYIKWNGSNDNVYNIVSEKLNIKLV
jgi:hypothetical protein